MKTRPYRPTGYAAGIEYDKRAVMPVLAELDFQVLVYGATSNDLMVIGEDCIMSRPVHSAAKRLGIEQGHYSASLFGIKDVRRDY